MDAPGHDLSNLVVRLKARSTQGPCNLDTWSDVELRDDLDLES